MTAIQGGVLYPVSSVQCPSQNDFGLLETSLTHELDHRKQDLVGEGITGTQRAGEKGEYQHSDSDAALCVIIDANTLVSCHRWSYKI
jgi:hypothetical protein